METEQIINSKLKEYYKNDGRKICSIVNKLLYKLRFHDVDVSDFYSLANEIIAKAIKKYDGKQDFDGYIYRCLENKFKTEMTRRNRYKRQADKMALSWETPLDEDSNSTIGDFITDTKKAEHYDIDKTFFEDDGEKYSERMLLYITKLSKLQKEVVKLIISGYSKEEITAQVMCFEALRKLEEGTEKE